MEINNYLKRAILVGIFATPFIPMMVSSSLFFPFITGKNFTFRVLVEVLALLFVILVARDKKYRPHFSPILIPIIAFLTIIGIADIFSVDPFKSFWSNFERMDGYITLLHLGAYFIIAGVILHTEKLWKWFFSVSLGVSIFLSIYGIFQLAGVLEIHQGGVRLDATFGNATYLAIYLLFHLFFIPLIYFKNPENHKMLSASWGIGLVLTIGYSLMKLAELNAPGAMSSGPAKTVFTIGFLGCLVLGILAWFIYARFKTRIATVSLGVLAIILEVIILYHTATRGAILGLVGGVILSSLIIIFLERGKNSAVKKASIIVFVGTVVVIAGFWGIKDAPFIQNSPVLNRFATISINETKTQARSFIWPMAIQGFKDRPLLGWGQESFNYIFNKYYDPKMYGHEQWFDRTHNIFLDWLVAGGILGLLGYISIFVFLFIELWRHREPNVFSTEEKSIITGVISAYLFYNFFTFDNIISYVLFFSILAYIYSRSQPNTPLTDSKIVKKPIENPVNPALPAAVSLVAIVIFVFILYSANIKPISAGTYLIDALPGKVVDQSGQEITGDSYANAKLAMFQKIFGLNTFANSEAREQLVSAMDQVNSSNASAGAKNNFFQFVKGELQKQIELTPDNARYEFFFGTFFLRYNFIDEALIHLRKAQALSPRKQTIFFQIGSAFIAKGDYEQALAVFKEAFELEENYIDARIMYAMGAIYAGKQVLADQLLAEVDRDRVASDNRILNAYADTNQYVKILLMLERRIEIDPTDEQAHISLAAAYLKLGRRADAIKEIQRIIELNPSFKEQGEFYIKEIQAGRNP